MAESLLDPEFLARLEYLYVVTRDLFTGHITAERLSKKFGVGQEFADYRPYVAGDDYRHIDWAAYARRDQLVIKLFAEEQELPIYIFIDASRSMTIGAPEKLLYAKKIAAALGYIGLCNLDPVIVVPFDAEMRVMSRRFQGRGQLSGLIGFLEAIVSVGPTDMGRAVREFVQRQPRRGLCVLLSDFLDRAGYEEAIRLLHYHRFDLLAVQVNDREELEPSLAGDVEIVDSETGEQLVVKLTPAMLEEYKQRYHDHYAELDRLCQLFRRRYMPVTTDHPFEDLILDVFRKGGLIR
jgi:uncharacterized protein (DUF58 family)